MSTNTEFDELAEPPAPPVSARTAGLRVELTTAPSLDHLARARPRRPRITVSQVVYYFLPYIILAACIVAAILIPKGLHR
jgi:hypothetical protein